jgi:hypothetical protein
MATPPSKLSIKALKKYQKQLKKSAAVIAAKGNGGYPTQATELTNSRTGWTDI